MSDDAEAATEWFTVTRTWYVQAPDWYTATRTTKRNGQEDTLQVSRTGQNPRPLPAGMHCKSCDGHACPDTEEPT